MRKTILTKVPSQLLKKYVRPVIAFVFLLALAGLAIVLVMNNPMTLNENIIPNIQMNNYSPGENLARFQKKYQLEINRNATDKDLENQIDSYLRLDDLVANLIMLRKAKLPKPTMLSVIFKDKNYVVLSKNVEMMEHQFVSIEPGVLENITILNYDMRKASTMGNILAVIQSSGPWINDFNYKLATARSLIQIINTELSEYSAEAYAKFSLLIAFISIITSLIPVMLWLLKSSHKNRV